MTKRELQEMATWAWDELQNELSHASEDEKKYCIVNFDNGYILLSYQAGLQCLGLDNDREDDGRCYLATEGGGIITPVFDAEDLADELESVFLTGGKK